LTPAGYGPWIYAGGAALLAAIIGALLVWRAKLH
jgi:hypothetical protein